MDLSQLEFWIGYRTEVAFGSLGLALEYDLYQSLNGETEAQSEHYSGGPFLFPSSMEIFESCLSPRHKLGVVCLHMFIFRSLEGVKSQRLTASKASGQLWFQWDAVLGRKQIERGGKGGFPTIMAALSSLGKQPEEYLWDGEAASASRSREPACTFRS